jgi:DNA polymerase III subunit gamma/tau
MSYVVLARKYRPRSFTEMVGQEHVVQALTNALTQQRLHHAYLFTGTRGVGKTTVSRILAKSLNCTGLDGMGGITASPCGACDACRDIDSGRYVDYVELDAASNRGVDEISQLLDQAVYKPVVGRFKVYMIDEVHMLSSTAFNAMLKTLEEPPDYLKFVLATTDPQKVPVTVLSRCLQFNLRPMAAETVFEHLGQVLAAEQVPSDPMALRLISRAARGSMRDALSLTDQAIAYAGGQLDEAQVRQMLGAVDRSHVARMVEAVAAQDGAALVRCADELRGLGLSAAGALEELAALAQQMAVLQAVPGALDDSDPEAARLRALAPLLAPDHTQLLYSIALHGRGELALAPDEYSGLVMVLLRLLAFAPTGSVAARAASAADGVPGEAVSVSTTASTPDLSRRAPPTSALQRSEAVRATATLPVAAPPVRHAPAVTPVAVTPAPVTMTASLRPPPGPAPALAARALPAAPVSPSPRSVAVPATAPESGGSSVPPWEDLPEAWPEDAAPAAPSFSASMTPAWVSETASGTATAASAVADGPPPARPLAVATEATPAVRGIDLGHAAAGWRNAVAASPDAGSADADSDADRIAQDRWGEIGQALLDQGAVAGLVRELAWQAQCLAVISGDDAQAPQRWRLRVERESLRQPSHRERLQAALSEALGGPQVLEVEPGAVTDSMARREARARQQAQQAAEDLILADPQVLQWLARFPGARIVPGSIRPR